ncbi:MAG TPA: ATP-binding protein [Gemmatimonadales bacterium]|nr:ATP-binding protein [Gemmatimonadales bacterium]
MKQSYSAYGSALGFAIAAVLLRWLLNPVLHETLPLLTLYGAVAAAVWVGGYRPAVLASIVGYLACNLLFIPHRGAFGLDQAHNLIGLVAYLVTSAIIIALGETMRRIQQRLSEEAGALAKLHALSSRLWRCRELRQGLDEILDAAIELMAADRGNVQLFDAERGVLTIAVQRGFGPPFLEFFQEVSAADDSACGRALRSGERTTIDDVELDPSFAPMREVARAAQFRSVASTPLLSREGKPLGILSTHWRAVHRPDKQSLRRLDLYVRQAADFIERHLIEAELRKSEQRLHDADRRKDEFLAILAHELRNPLAPILNGLSVLNGVSDDPAAAGSARRMIGRQLEQMVRLIDDLLDVNRITRDTIELHKERVELASAVHNAVASCWPLVDRAQQDLSVKLPSHSVYLNVDRIRFAQILSNLIGNASKFTPHGGKITITAERQNHDVVLSVKDSGIGIAPHELHSVFEMFWRAKSPLEEPSGGMGIGLALVQRLVELHGGSVIAQSDGPGRGSDFVIRLPVVVDTQLPVRPPSPEPRLRPTQRRRVLIVDDNHDSADSLAMLLKLSGHETRVAYDGEQALGEAASYQPDCILLDVGMPKLNGYEACRRIRAQRWGQAATIIALTGWGQEDDRRKSREAGFDRHLIKPVDEGLLMKALEVKRATGRI